MEKVYFDLETFSVGGVSLKFSEKDLMEFYEDTQEQLEILMSVDKAIKELPSDATIEDFLDIVLMGDKIISMDLSTLRKFLEAWTSKMSRVNRRVRSYVCGVTELQELFETHLEMFIPFGPEDFSRVKVLLGEMIGQISYFLFYQFEFDRTIGSDEVPYIISTYCHRIGRDISEFVEEQDVIYQKNIIDNKPHMSAFDKYPGLVDDFYLIAPDYSYDIDLIDIETLQKVVNREIPVEELDEYMEIKFGEEAIGEI